MKLIAPLILAAGLAGMVQAETRIADDSAPALKHFEATVIDGDLWERPGLNQRDRSVVTVATLIARDQTSLMPAEFARALDNGVTPAELSGIVTHLAFYSGMANAASAVDVLTPLYAERGVDLAALPGGEVEFLPLDQAVEDAREAGVQANHAETAIGVVDYTRDVLFRDLWLRPDLAPRDRSLVTVTALVAVGQAEQVPFHLGRAMDNGLTRDEASEALTQLAFYAGWPRVFSAMPVFREVFDSRAAAE